jgi:glycerate kinase
VSSVPERPVLVAPDSFKGTFRATEVAAAIGRGLERAGLMPPDLCPVADGGEGTLEALLVQLGGETAAARVRDPLGARDPGRLRADRGGRRRDRRNGGGERAGAGDR